MDRISGGAVDNVHENNIRSLTKSLYELRKPESSDTVLVCQGKELYAHRLVLQARSPYFQSVFNNKEESQNGRIIFKDIEPETMEAILDYMYLGSVENFEASDQIHKILEVAHFLNMHELLEHCLDKLMQRSEKTELEKPDTNLLTIPDVVAKSGLSSDVASNASSLLTSSSESSSDEQIPPNQDSPKRSLESWFSSLVHHHPKHVPCKLGCFIRLGSFWMMVAVGFLALLCLFWPPISHNGFAQDLLACINSKPEAQYGCINSLLKFYPPTNSLKSRTFRLPGTGLLHFVFHESARPENVLHGGPRKFMWKMTYYSDYRSIQSRDWQFCKSWWGKLFCPEIKAVSVDGIEFFPD